MACSSSRTFSDPPGGDAEADADAGMPPPPPPAPPTRDPPLVSPGGLVSWTSCNEDGTAHFFAEIGDPYFDNCEAVGLIDELSDDFWLVAIDDWDGLSASFPLGEATPRGRASVSIAPFGEYQPTGTLEIEVEGSRPTEIRLDTDVMSGWLDLRTCLSNELPCPDRRAPADRISLSVECRDGARALSFAYHPETPSRSCVAPDSLSGDVLRIEVPAWDPNVRRYTAGRSATASLSSSAEPLSGRLEIQTLPSRSGASIRWNFGDAPLLRGEADLDHCALDDLPSCE
ncbi:MAG: hypothetical protein AAGF12_36895 [Myxococcota bacterium]